MLRPTSPSILWSALLLAGCGAARPSADEPASPASPPATAVPAVAPTPAIGQATPAVPVASAGDRNAGIAARLAAPRLTACVETSLPAAQRPARRGPVGDNLGRGLAIDVPRGTVTAGNVGGTSVVVYETYRLDPASELGDAGVRVRLAHPDGHTEDLSLGFSTMRPWVVFHDPLLPLLDGDTVQLAADVREIDDGSITFPPVGLQARREVRDRLLRCPLSALRADADGDGLTDLEEERLATDPADPDTDGDQLIDSEDPSPLGATPPASTAQQVWVAAFRQVIARDMHDDLLLVESANRLAIDGPVTARVLFLTTDELSAYQRKFGRHVTFSMGVTVADPDHASVSVSFGWRGAAYQATRAADGTWTFVGGMTWIS